MYSATYKQKPVIKLAPDAIVKIHGGLTIDICPNGCHKQMVISNYITSISTNLSTAGTVGTASITISMPRHGHKGTYMVRGGRVYGVRLMDEIEIFIKGRFKNTNGNYSYYKSFWGVVTGIDERYVSGNQEITINCESMLKWLQLMKTNEHPSIQVFQNTDMKFDTQATLWAGKSYSLLNVYEIIYSMLDLTYKNIVVPNALDTERTNTQSTFKDSDGKQVATNDRSPMVSPKESQLITAWSGIFSKMLSALKMYGAKNEDIKPKVDTKQQGSNAKDDVGISASKDPKSPVTITYDYGALMDFRPFNKPDEHQAMDIIHNTYKNNLTIIEEVKMFSGFEFYLDTTGDFVFKPPFWNLDVRQNPVYVIKDRDVINWDWSESDADVVTRVEVTGSLFSEIPIDSNFNPIGVYTNYALARQFGIKVEAIPMRFFLTADFCYYHAISELDRFNAHRFKGTMTILGRPELRLGMPVYIQTRDCFAYIENISHSFTFGGSFTTTLSLSSVRRRYNPETSLNIEKVVRNDNQKKNSNSGEYFLILENDNSTQEQIFNANQKQNEAAAQAEINKQNTSRQQKINVPLQATATEEKTAEQFATETGSVLRTNRSGNYVEYHISSEKAQNALKDFKAAKNAKDPKAYLKVLEKAIPVSDSDGFELIGIYENGKSLSFDAYSILRTRDVNSSKQTASTVTNTKPDSEDVTTVSDDVSAVLNDIPANSNISGFLQYRSESLANLTPVAVKESTVCKVCQDPELQDIRFKSSFREDSTLQNTINNIKT